LKRTVKNKMPKPISRGEESQNRPESSGAYALQCKNLDILDSQKLPLQICGGALI
jgi:hypothetical protein